MNIRNLWRSIRGRHQHKLICNQWFSTTKKPITNPLSNRPYTEVVRLLETGVSQKNEQNFHRLVMEDAIARSEVAHANKIKESYAENTAKEKLMNAVFERMLQKTKNLQIEDVYLFIKFSTISQDSRYFRISSSYKEKFKKELNSRLHQLILQDRFGKKKEIFKKILYTLVRSKRITFILKELIDYLGNHIIKTNPQYLHFFQEMTNFNNTGFYDVEVSPMIHRYMNPDFNNLQNASEWVKPIILKFILFFKEGGDSNHNRLLIRFVSGLEHVLSHGEIKINDQIQIFSIMLQRLQLYSPYEWNTNQISRMVQITDTMMKSIRSKIEGGVELSMYQQLVPLLQSISQFQNFLKTHFQFLQRPLKQLLQQYKSFKLLAIRKHILADHNKFSLSQYTTLLSKELQLPVEEEKLLLEALIKTLNKEKNTNTLRSLISRMRVYEYVARMVTIQNIQIDLTLFLENLWELEKQCQAMKEYEIIRLYNIFRILKLDSPILTKIFNFNMEKKETIIIENFSRTYLKNLSLPLIIEALDRMLEKAQNQNNAHLLISNGIWSSTKNIIRQRGDENRDPIMKYWLHTKYPSFREFTSNYDICYYIFSSVINQIYYSNGAFNSGSIEMLVEVLKSWMNQNPSQNNQQFYNLVFMNIKVLIQSWNLLSTLENGYRHSCLVKLIWAFYAINNSAHSLKNFKQFKQFQRMIRYLPAQIYRDRNQLKYLLLLNCAAKIMQNNEQDKIKKQSFWSWVNYHQHNEIPMFLQDIWKTQKSSSKMSGLAFLEQCLAKGSNIDQFQVAHLSKKGIPIQIIDGSLTPESAVPNSTILDLLVYHRVMRYLFNKFPKLGDNFITKISQMGVCYNGSKLIEAANLVHYSQHVLSRNVVVEFRKWVHNILEKNYPAGQCSSFAELWAYFNHTNKQTEAVMRDYVTQELRQGNFYIISTFYINNYTNFQEEAKQFLDVVDSCHIMPYLENQPKLKAMVLTNILGFCLNQTSPTLLTKYLDMFWKQLTEIINLLRQQQILALYPLLLSCQSMLPQQSAYLPQIESVLQALKSKYPELPTSIVHQLQRQTVAVLDRAGVQYERESGWCKYGGQLVVADGDRPGAVRHAVGVVKGEFGVSVGVLNEWSL